MSVTYDAACTYDMSSMLVVSASFSGKKKLSEDGLLTSEESSSSSLPIGVEALGVGFNKSHWTAVETISKNKRNSNLSRKLNF